MRARLLVAVAASIALTGCTTINRTVYHVTGKPSFDPKHPQVYVVAGANNTAYIVVDQEPILFIKDEGKVKIQWKLNNSKYKFSGSGIKIAAKPVSGRVNPLSGCSGNGDDEFDCDNDTAVAGTVKYTIAVEPKNSGDPAPKELDPYIVNN